MIAGRAMLWVPSMCWLLFLHRAQMCTGYWESVRLPSSAEYSRFGVEAGRSPSTPTSVAAVLSKVGKHIASEPYQPALLLPSATTTGLRFLNAGCWNLALTPVNLCIVLIYVGLFVVPKLHLFYAVFLSHACRYPYLITFLNSLPHGEGVYTTRESLHQLWEWNSICWRH